MYLCWYIVSIAIIGSDEDTRVVCIRECDTCDNAVLQQSRAVAVLLPEALHCLSWSLEIERRSLVAARPKPANTTKTHRRSRSGIRCCKDQKPFNVVEAALTHAGVGETYAITLVVSIEEPGAPSLTAAAVNAFEYFMRHRQTAHPEHSSSADLTYRGSLMLALQMDTWVRD